jgi:hypothetical protein
MFYKVLYTSMHTYFESGKHWPQHGAFGQTGIDPSQGFPMEKWTVLDAAQRHSKLQRDFTNCNAMASLPNIAGLIKIDSYDLVCTSYVMSWLETNSSNSACVCMCNCHPRCDSQIMDMDAWSLVADHTVHGLIQEHVHDLAHPSCQMQRYLQ